MQAGFSVFFHSFGRATLAAALLTAGTGCYRNTRVTVDIRVPGMQCAACATLVRSSLQTLDPEALLHFSVELGNRTVRATYESTQIALRNIQHAIAEAGFDADDVPAYPDARDRLPEFCRSHVFP